MGYALQTWTLTKGTKCLEVYEQMIDCLHIQLSQQHIHWGQTSCKGGLGVQIQNQLQALKSRSRDSMIEISGASLWVYHSLHLLLEPPHQPTWTCAPSAASNIDKQHFSVTQAFLTPLQQNLKSWSMWHGPITRIWLRGLMRCHRLFRISGCHASEKVQTQQDLDTIRMLLSLEVRSCNEWEPCSCLHIIHWLCSRVLPHVAWTFT